MVPQSSRLVSACFCGGH